MTDKIILQGEINEQGELIIQLPSDMPRGAVQVTIEHTTEFENNTLDEELEQLITESINSEGLPMGEIELPDEPVFGKDFPDGKTYVEQIRKKRRYSW